MLLFCLSSLQANDNDTIPLRGSNYEDSLEVAEKAIQEALANIPSNHPEIFTEAPIYKGVNALVETHVELLVIASVKEEHVYDAERIIKREIKLAYEKAGLQSHFTPCLCGDTAVVGYRCQPVPSVFFVAVRKTGQGTGYRHPSRGFDGRHRRAVVLYDWRKGKS